MCWVVVYPIFYNHPFKFQFQDICRWEFVTSNTERNVMILCFDLVVSVVSNRVNPYYPRHLDSNTAGCRYNAVQYTITCSAVVTAAENKQYFEYEYFLKHNSLRPHGAPVSYIIIGWDNGFSPAATGHYPNQCVCITNRVIWYLGSAVKLIDEDCACFS